MDYFYLVMATFCVPCGSIIGGKYARKTVGKKSPLQLYSLIMFSVVALFWATMFLLERKFEAKILLYAIPMGCGLALANISNVTAMKHGPVSLTALLLQLSYICVTVWGFFFWGEKVTEFSIIGLSLAVLSISLCLYEKADEDKQKNLSWKWLLFAGFLFLSNATCSIIQRTQQTNYEGAYKNMFMFFASSIAVIAFIFMYAVKDKSDDKEIFKKTGWLPALGGVNNVAYHLLIMLLATSSVPPSLIYSLLAVGGITINSVASIFLFQEKLHWWQWLGIAIGAVAVVFLSL